MTADHLRREEWAVTLPSLGWLLALFAAPTLLVFAVSFRPADPYGGIGAGWTLATLREMARTPLGPVIARTVRLSALTTAICLALAIPCGTCLARVAPRRQAVLLLLVVVPFWTSFLIRVFAWRMLLHPEGPLKRVLVTVGLADPHTQLLYSEPAVLLVMVYTFLPFAILPIYAAAEKFDLALLEAARDLGAGPWGAFVKVFLPGIGRGVLTATLMVLIPALGSYVIPDLVGGPGQDMLGNRIAQRAFSDRNLPQASALSAALTLAALAPMALAALVQRRPPALEAAARKEAA